MKRRLTEVSMKLPERLKRLMEHKNRKKQGLADMLGVTRQVVRQYLNGTTIPPTEKVVKMAQYFGVTTDYIVGLSDNPGNIDLAIELLMSTDVFPHIVKIFDELSCQVEDAGRKIREIPLIKRGKEKL